MTKPCKILAIDIGAGTQDILYYDSLLTPENCTSLILPTPTRFFAQQIENCRQDLFIEGDPIGGGAVSQKLREHIEKGFGVTMTEDAAYTVRNNLGEVRSYGIDISAGKENKFNGAQLRFEEINIPRLKHFLSTYGENLEPELIALAVQDHGTPPRGTSNREFRFQHISDRLREDKRPEHFVYKSNEIPPYLKRMNAIARTAKRQAQCDVVLMDTAFAAILGCMDESPSGLFINVGNSHTLAALVSDGMICGLFEHHTSCLTREKLEGFLVTFQRGTLSSQEVREDGGHGSIVLDGYTAGNGEAIIVTGPNRKLLEQSRLAVRFAAPHGNMMLTGPFGLVNGALLRQNNNH